MTDADFAKIVRYWSTFLAGRNWEELAAGTVAKTVGCGQVYELPGLSKPGQELCIADMRELTISEPHYHPDNNYEIYVVITGTAKLVVGRDETPVHPGMAVTIPPNHAHYAIPSPDFVTAAINIPGYTDENYIVTTRTDPRVKFDLSRYKQLELAGAAKRRQGTKN